MNHSLFRIIVLAVATTFIFSAVDAQDLNTFGTRSFLCIKRVGKKDAGSNRGRDAYLNPSPCPGGYFTIDLSSFNLKATGETGVKGDKGDKGDTGAQGAPGMNGGSIVGRLVSCQFEENEQGENEEEEPLPGNPCELAAKSKRSKKDGGFEIYIQGESFAARPDANCVFRISNIPEGTYDLSIDKRYIGNWIRGVGDVNVTEGTTTNLGDIPLCRDFDRDGFDRSLDCNDWNKDVNPDAQEVCDGSDNNCNGTVDEGCVPPSEETPPS